ncbi:calcium-binding protein [Salipiger abyssi]|uniref:Putative calcium-binding protein n=1 Tax=Salipiger abyssi TaxID=1250539 RepID=A0A1P8URB4_9RHOB|nr:calcium-binding protein [Salipiger abyssi]APZ51943.1 putative calcium-binding protein [Salipiger abyssi]
MVDIIGTVGNDDGVDNPALIGTDADDTISGLSGADLLQGLGGSDFLNPGVGQDTVEAGAGDDRVILVHTVGNGSALYGGDGFDRLILQQSVGVTYGYDQAIIDGFERVDLNGSVFRIRPEQLDGITQITGFGYYGEIRIRGGGTAYLGDITLGENNNAVGRITAHYLAHGSDPATFPFVHMTWDATGSTGRWWMEHDVAFDAHYIEMLGGNGEDTLTGMQGDTIDGGGGDDRIIPMGDNGFTRLRPYSVVSGGDGTDVFVGAVSYNAGAGNPSRNWSLQDHSRTVIDGFEVLEGGGIFTRAGLDGFETLQMIEGLTITTPGTLDLTGRLESVAPDYDLSTGEIISYTLEVRYAGASLLGPNSFSLTDHWARIAITGGDAGDTFETGVGHDTLRSFDGNDTLRSGDGNDRVFGGGGSDVIVTWGSEADGSDTVDGGSGDNYIETGAGNDFVIGRDGNDTILGGDGADSLQGGSGDDVLSGGGLADVLYDGDGMDFINGGYGYDRIELLEDGGADSIFHAGVAGHGTDWIRGFEEEDALVTAFGVDAADFIVQQANTAGAGDAAVDELFVSYVPTGQILWALVDGAALTELTLQIGETDYDLLA